ncbi:MAG: DUF3859 domain-containing protein [Bacteroidales bacterium]|nr:DUF3859 domain-containing protein [Bacteroidales bacterium]
MPKKNPEIKTVSYGRYTPWERGSRHLPKILEFTSLIAAIEGNEFGMIIKITGGRGIRLEYRIQHPPFKDASGRPEPDFTGEYYVPSNEYEFYIGDCIWLPVEDKAGAWIVSVYFEGKSVAKQKFEVILLSP